MNSDDRFDALIHHLQQEDDEFDIPAPSEPRPAPPARPTPVASNPPETRPSTLGEGRFLFRTGEPAPQPTPTTAPRQPVPIPPEEKTPAPSVRPVAPSRPIAQPPVGGEGRFPLETAEPAPRPTQSPRPTPAQAQIERPANRPAAAGGIHSSPGTANNTIPQPTPVPVRPMPLQDDRWEDGDQLISSAAIANELHNIQAPPKSAASFQMQIRSNEFANLPETVPPKKTARPPAKAKPARKESRLSPVIRVLQSFSVVIIVLFISVFLAYFMLASASDLFGLNQPDEMVTVVFPKDSVTADFVRILGERGVVTQPFTLTMYLKLKGFGDDFRSGTYEFNANYSYDEIIDMLLRGDGSDIVRVTIIEGTTLNSIARQLEEAYVCKADDFIAALETEAFDYDFMADVPEGPLRFRTYEGYLFPDTYEFYKDSDPETVIAKFFSNFQKRVYKENILARIKDAGMSLDEVITLASIIQKESGTFSEMERVSSVFHNRLAPDSELPMLQSDVTIFYVEGSIKPYFSEEEPNQSMYDAYNTYVCEGLPIGPICNPGLAAIEAVLAPADTDYYFFVTDQDGDYYFAKTLAEHERNCRAAQAKGDAVGIATGEQSA